MSLIFFNESSSCPSPCPAMIFISQFDFTCGDAWKQTFVYSLTLAGIMVGAFFLGPLADM